VDDVPASLARDACAPPPSAARAGPARLAIDRDPVWVVRPGALGRAENLAFSRDESLLAVVDTDGERVLVYERRGDGPDFGERPALVLEGEEAGLDYPHDVDFSADGRRLLVANRSGRSLLSFRRLSGSPVRFAPRPSWRLKGRTSALGYCDGVKLAPPDGRLLAAANLREHRVTFFRPVPMSKTRFRRRPAATIEGDAAGLAHPDGLAFSPDGDALAVGNHGVGTVVVYARSRGAVPYGPRPVATLGGGDLRCPHSLAFTRDGDHLAVTEAGGRFVTVYARSRAGAWHPEPVLRFDATPADVHPADQEGGPKGVAFARDLFAYCSPEAGVRLHRLRSVS
jgi:sugar lactone lactonase YvrE